MTKDVIQHHEHMRAPGIWDWFGNGWPAALRMFEPDKLTRIEEFVQDNRYVVRTELPGIDPDKDVEVTIQDGILNIHGERREDRRDDQRSEFYYGSFSRSVMLPSGADEQDVKATYKDGVLEVSVKLGEIKTETKKISIEHAA